MRKILNTTWTMKKMKRNTEKERAKIDIEKDGMG